jgi:hypothetical protein
MDVELQRKQTLPASPWLLHRSATTAPDHLMTAMSAITAIPAISARLC